MTRYTVKTLVTFERFYEVEAENEKAAIEASTNASPTSEELIEEETMGVYLDGIKQRLPWDTRKRAYSGD